MKGAFTGAIAERKGWLEQCGPLGAVFLDEIGELDMAIQIKLLRVPQQRKFQRLGDTQDRIFEGNIGRRARRERPRSAWESTAALSRSRSTMN